MNEEIRIRGLVRESTERSLATTEQPAKRLGSPVETHINLSAALVLAAGAVAAPGLTKESRLMQRSSPHAERATAIGWQLEQTFGIRTR